MDAQLIQPWTRRGFLGRLTAASAAGLLGLRTGIAAAKPPPETTSINIVYDPDIPILYYGPQYVATEMLRLEGFTDIGYAPFIDAGLNDAEVVGVGNADISACWVGDLITEAESGVPVVGSNGMHIGCNEVFAHEGIKSFRDLKGKKVGLYTEGSAEPKWFAMVFAYIGLDPEESLHDLDELIGEGNAS